MDILTATPSPLTVAAATALLRAFKSRPVRTDPWQRKIRKHRRGDNLHKRAARGAARLQTNVVRQAQIEIEGMLREKGVRWHTYMREMSMIPRGRVSDDKRAYFAFQNAVRKYGRVIRG